MIAVTKIFTFDAGHRLMKHEGACKNLHGHTYKLEVTVTTNATGHDGKELDKNDMIVDFKDLKHSIKNVLEKFDHAMILNKEDGSTISHCINNRFKYVVLDGDPTAEKIVNELAKIIRKHLPSKITFQKNPK